MVRARGRGLLTPALGPGVVYYGAGAYRLKDGAALWTVEVPAQQWSAGPGFAVGVFAKNQLAAVDAANGELLWTWTAPGGTGTAQIPLREGPAIVNGKVVALVEMGLVAILDAEDGKVIACRDLTSLQPDPRDVGLNDYPVIAGGLLFVRPSAARCSRSASSTRRPLARLGRRPGEALGGLRARPRKAAFRQPGLDSTEEDDEAK